MKITFRMQICYHCIVYHLLTIHFKYFLLLHCPSTSCTPNHILNIHMERHALILFCSSYQENCNFSPGTPLMHNSIWILRQKAVLCTHQNGCGNPDNAPTIQAATQVSCCKEWQSLSLIRGDSNDNSYMLHDQTDKVLSSLVMELQEELERLRSIREAKEDKTGGTKLCLESETGVPTREKKPTKIKGTL